MEQENKDKRKFKISLIGAVLGILMTFVFFVPYFFSTGNLLHAYLYFFGVFLMPVGLLILAISGRVIYRHYRPSIKQKEGDVPQDNESYRLVKKQLNGYLGILLGIIFLGIGWVLVDSLFWGENYGVSMLIPFVVIFILSGMYFLFSGGKGLIDFYRLKKRGKLIK